MKALIAMSLLFLAHSAFAVTWTYQVNVNGNPGTARKIDATRTTFEAGAHYCEVTPVVVTNGTEYRSITCGVGASTVSTGGLCTRKGVKVASVQYAILNINSPKQAINVVVACQFD